ncbi:hypothetical protein D9613_001917 [Agrocybe pediades]|uniref:P-loop containing nucleoside triphosphate hydrolase protein n=1 Tax=Agrocybe pediades TaxID=84607 RepID=A0A8H4VUF8_9AGAR|nr:hypothetical protein D9613_001917 [Agrocybe pediades]
MGKKKKTQLKPVQRGFATTSTPKKVVQEEPPKESGVDDSPHIPLDDKESEENASLGGVAVRERLISDEESILQGFVDRLQEKTEKEITRTVKAIEVDRRFAQTLPRLDIDPVFRKRIVDLATEDNDVHDENRSLDDTEDKLIGRLGITYGVLRKLGFSEERVQECLRSVDGIAMDEALDWMFLHCSDAELSNSEVQTQQPLSPVTNLAGGVIARKLFTPPSTPPPERETITRHTDTTVQQKQKSTSTQSPLINNLSDDRKTETKDSSIDEGHVQEIHEDSEEDEDIDPTTRHVRLQLRLDDVQFGPRSQAKAVQIGELKKKMNDLKQDYLFSQKEANSLYQAKKKQADKLRLHARLTSEPPNTATNVKKSKTPGASEPKATPSPSIDKVSVDGDESDDSSSGMLGILEDPDSTEVTIKGVTYSLRDMALPKNWSGPTPKTMLRDFVARADKYAAIFYSQISSHSRARRASVTISWQHKGREEWTMEDVACPDDSQAEQYVSAIALHSLLYPVTDGFVASAPSSTGGSTSFRLLPAVFRDLWDELEQFRRNRDDSLNRQTWEKLRVLLASKLQRNTMLAEKQENKAADKRPAIKQQIAQGNTGNIEAMAESFRVRQSTAAYQDMLSRRNELPIAQYRERIIDTLERSQVLVLSGETGCGKSTQVPAFILEDQLSKGKPCRIFCTEPRRISAISLAQRVAFELCDPPNVGSANSLVGYSIRLENNISRNTRLAFVTNGIALRMLEGGSGQGGNGTAFDEITHLIIDEWNDLILSKVILMSATLDAEKISNYFGNCETLQVPGRTFPVEVQYLEDAIEYTNWRVSEDSPYARRLNDKFYKGKKRPEWSEDLNGVDDDDDDDINDNQDTAVKLEKRYSPETAYTLNNIDERLIPYDLIIRLLEKMCYEDQTYISYSQAILIFMPGLGEIRRLHDILSDHPVFGSNAFKLYPLHSTLSSESQGAVFDVPPVGIRKIVIATNIAETGITIPDITCVIDTGKHREMRFDEKRQISRLIETFVAKSNAAQRRGRAGRVQTGLCFHLFTRVRYETQMAENPLPEMMRLSLSDLALRIKIMKIKLGSSIEDVLARALDPPVSINVQRAVSMLIEVRALTTTEDITPMGRLLSKLPTDVHLGKFLLTATLFRCLDPALTIAATLNSKSPFVSPLGQEKEADLAKSSFRIENSDFLTIHNAFSSWRRACANLGSSRNFCRKNYLSQQNLQQIEDLRQQFLGYLIDSQFIQVDRSVVQDLSRARYTRNRTRFVEVPRDLDVNSDNPAIIHAALAGGLYPKMLAIDNKNGQMRTITNNQQAFFHPSSVNFRKNPLDLGSNYLAYFTLMQRLYAWETAPIDDVCLILLCGEFESKLLADTVSVDRKIRLQVSPRTNIALKILRERLSSILAQQFQGKTLSQSQSAWMELATLALSRTKLESAKDDAAIGIR